MSLQTRSLERSKTCSEDLSAKQHYIVQLDANGDIEVGEGPTDFLVGVLQNTPASGKEAVYRFLGTAKVICGGAVTVGAQLTSDTAGKAVVTTTDGDVVIGRALQAGDTNDIIEVQLCIQNLYIA